jgi:glutamate 5-kinase
MERQTLKDKRRIVVKIGSSSLTHRETGKIDFYYLEKFVRQIVDLKNSGREVLIVTSGAIAVGISELGLHHKPESIEEKQAVAAVGQSALMMIYQKLFSEYNQNVGQVLLTKDIIDRPDRKENAVNTLNALLKLGVIPIVNENDTVSTEEIEFGDNDTLSALVAGIVGADLVILLSDINGLYNDNPKNNPDAKLINKVYSIDNEVEGMASGAGSLVGTGGMITKIHAAKIAKSYGIYLIIANSKTDNIIHRIMTGADVGTIFINN